MEIQQAKERLLEAENLTDNLDDESADWLLHWGIGHLDGLVNGITDEEVAGENVNALMAVMRQLNRIGEMLSAGRDDRLEVNVREFFAQYHRAFPASAAPKSSEAAEAVKAIVAKPPRAGLEYLLKLVEKQ